MTLPSHRLYLPSRERSHVPPNGKKENHLQEFFLGGDKLVPRRFVSINLKPLKTAIQFFRKKKAAYFPMFSRYGPQGGWENLAYRGHEQLDVTDRGNLAWLTR